MMIIDSLRNDGGHQSGNQNRRTKIAMAKKGKKTMIWWKTKDWATWTQLKSADETMQWPRKNNNDLQKTNDWATKIPGWNNAMTMTVKQWSTKS